MTVPILCQLNHVATTQQLVECGAEPRRLRQGVAAGELLRLRPGVLACSHLPSPTARAVRLGGALTCVSVLREAGVWAGHSHQLHVQVPPTSSSATRVDGGIRLHWAPPRFGMTSRWRTTPTQALWQAMHCLDEENAIAAMESAVHMKFLTAGRVTRLAPRRLQRAVQGLVFTSGSGNESIVRLRLERTGFQVESQAFVPGMGHEDLVVEDCVGLDVDSRQWHGEDRFAIDRDRDLHVEGFGRRALRLRPAHIFETWPHTLAVIERAVADARREQQRRAGRVIVRADDPL